MDIKNWLRILETVGLTALQSDPRLAPIAGPVAAAIAEAEQMPGKSGAEKLQHVVAIAGQAATAAHAAGVQIDPVAVQAAAVTGISTAVTVTNIVHGAHAGPLAGTSSGAAS